jgi:hypothetical protein
MFTLARIAAPIRNAGRKLGAKRPLDQQQVLMTE